MVEDQTIVKALIERYPFLAPYNVFTGELDEDYDYSYIFPLELLLFFDIHRLTV